MKAIRSDNDGREMKREGQTEKRKEKKMASYGKLLMTQTKAGVEEMCQLGSVLGAPRYLSCPRENESRRPLAPC